MLAVTAGPYMELMTESSIGTAPVRKMEVPQTEAYIVQRYDYTAGKVERAFHQIAPVKTVGNSSAYREIRRILERLHTGRRRCPPFP